MVGHIYYNQGEKLVTQDESYFTCVSGISKLRVWGAKETIVIEEKDGELFVTKE